MALRSALGSRLDSKEPDWTKFQDFLKGEVRFASFQNYGMSFLVLENYIL
jgi:hypothetical protein